MTKRGGSLDTNVLLRLILADIPAQYAAALELFESGAQLEISDTAVIEAMYALNEYYSIPRIKIQKTFQKLATNQKLQINMAVFEPALELYASQPALSIEDCYLVALAAERGHLPLWTFDKKLARQSNGLAKELGPV